MLASDLDFVVKKAFDLIVIGAGSGGLAAAKRASSYGARVAIIEANRVGGTCVIRGCVPKKLLVYGSLYNKYLKDACDFGIKITNPIIESSVLLANVRREVDRLNQLHIDLLANSGVELIQGRGRIASTSCVVVENLENPSQVHELSTKNILIAVGSRPCRPSFPGASLGWVSDDIFLLNKFPQAVVIVGGGFIACEFACIFRGLGVDVIQLVRGDRLLKGFDRELAIFLQDNMVREGVDLRFGESPTRLKGKRGDIDISLSKGEDLNCEAVLFATGREPFLEGLNLDKIGVKTKDKSIKVNSINATNIPNIFAIGDVTDRINLTPVAIEEGRVLADRLYGEKIRKINYELVPKAVFSQPEMASVGLTEEEAILKFGKEKITTFRAKFRPMSESLQKSERRCLLKLIIEEKSNKILGCHMIGDHSAEIIQMASIAISMGAKKEDFDCTMALHPTISEEFVTMR